MADNRIMPRPSYEAEVKDCDRLFQTTLSLIRHQRGYVVDLPLLVRAYETAKSYHGDTRRHSGVLYLRHPLAVMEELARLRCKTSVLAAAVLHDTMEDCAVTYEYLREHFSYEIAEIVSAVTAIKAEEKEKEAPERMAAMTAWERHTFLDQLTDAKLISSKFQREAFLVRFADRVHNLSTIDACSPVKRKEKIASTRAFLIPAAEKLGMRYFSVLLQDECLRFDGEDYAKNHSALLLARRNALIQVGRKAYSQLDQVLQDALAEQNIFTVPQFNPFLKLRGSRRMSGEEPQTVQRRALLAYELQIQWPDRAEFDRSQMDLWEVLLTCRERGAAAMVHQFLTQFATPLRDAGIFYEIAYLERETAALRLTDSLGNRYRIVLIPEARLEAYFIGDANGDRLTMIDEEAPCDALRPQMTVYTYSVQKGYKKYEKCVPQGATALDFAFIVSPTLAHTTKGAWIHTWQGESATAPFTAADHCYPMGTVLNDGDVVHFDADYVPHVPTSCIYHTTIDRFDDINTEYARKCLIRYFKDRFPVQSEEGGAGMAATKAP